MPGTPNETVQRRASENESKPRVARFARVLGYVLNPLIVPPIALGILAAHSGASDKAFYWIVTRAVVLYVLLPGAMLYLFRRQKRIQSIEIRIRKNRIVPLVGGAALSLAAIPAVSIGAGESQAIIALVAGCMALASALAVLLTMKVKLSLHAAAYSGLFVFLMWMAWLVPDAASNLFHVTSRQAAFSVVLIPLVGWGRIQTGVHTRAEVGIGILFGLVVTAVSLYVGGGLVGITW